MYGPGSEIGYRPGSPRIVGSSRSESGLSNASCRCTRREGRIGRSNSGGGGGDDIDDAGGDDSKTDVGDDDDDADDGGGRMLSERWVGVGVRRGVWVGVGVSVERDIIRRGSRKAMGDGWATGDTSPSRDTRAPANLSAVRWQWRCLAQMRGKARQSASAMSDKTPAAATQQGGGAREDEDSSGQRSFMTKLIAM